MTSYLSKCKRKEKKEEINHVLCLKLYLKKIKINIRVTCNSPYIAGTGGLTSSVSTLFPEEAVNEVKRQAMSELQKAVSEAERKAHEIITSERAKMERTVAEAKRQAAEDALSIINQQEDSSEVRTCKHINKSVTHPLVR